MIKTYKKKTLIYKLKYTYGVYSECISNLIHEVINSGRLDTSDIALMLFRSGMTLSDIDDFLYVFDDDGEEIEGYFQKNYKEEGLV